MDDSYVARAPRAQRERVSTGRASRGDARRPEAWSHASTGVLSGLSLVRYWVLAGLWTTVTVTFWVWWFEHGAPSGSWLYWLQTAALLYQTAALPVFYWWFVGRMRRPVEVAPPADVRVAMISLCVPSHESVEVIREQLDALEGVSFPHDSWLLDEGGSEELRALAEARGVRYFSRCGIERWNQPIPPFQRATKAGNVNAWLDHIQARGIDYDVFVQLDIDHRPRRDYLDRVLGYFRDPVVAWVQAPSVCGNLDNWVARGLAEQDLVFQGPLQMGFYGASRTPFIIGSHTAYRTAAIRQIGGFQPTRAEDHLDTVVLAAQGWRGVFVPELIATGDGPRHLGTYMRQQFAWAYSMIQIFLRHTPRLIWRYSPRQAFQFLMCQSWYTLWSTTLALLWLLPPVALVIHRPIAAVRLSEFLLHFVPVILVSSLMWCETRRWFQPTGVRLSWRAALLEVVRWPVVVWALVNVLLAVKRPYMITPKGGAGTHGLSSLSLYAPYIALSALQLAAIWVFKTGSGADGIEGYYGLVLLNAAVAAGAVLVAVLLEIRQLASESGALAAVRRRAGALTCALGLAAGAGGSALAVWEPMAAAIA
ncbi:MAG: glycosyltransferase family 2 protein [Solirubrobacteraceae bacterium]